jgi:hypothetical protein
MDATSLALNARSHSATSAIPPRKKRPVKTGLSPMVNAAVFVGLLV